MAFGFLKKLRGNKGKAKDEAATDEAATAEEAAEEVVETTAAEGDESAPSGQDQGDVTEEVVAPAEAGNEDEGEEEEVAAAEGEGAGQEGALDASVDSRFVLMPQEDQPPTLSEGLVPATAEASVIHALSRTGSVTSMRSSQGVPPSGRGPRKSPHSSVAGSTSPSHRGKGPQKFLKKVPKHPAKSPSGVKSKTKAPPPPSVVPPKAISREQSADEVTQEIQHTSPSPARGDRVDMPPGAPDGPTSMHVTEDATAVLRGANLPAVSSDDDESDGPTFEAISPPPPSKQEAPTPTKPEPPKAIVRTVAPPVAVVKPIPQPRVESRPPPTPPEEEEYDYEYAEEEEVAAPRYPVVEKIGSGNKAAKLIVAERFLGLLAPRQFGGKVLKLKNVAILDDTLEEEVSRKTVWLQRESNKRLLYDEVQMVPSDVGEVDPTGLAETPMTMVVVDGQDKCYVETEREAIKLLATEGSVSSVYVIDKQAVMARESAITTVASLVVVWRPHSSPSEEYNCAVHHKPMELYDPITRDVACALCSAVEGRKMLVLSEVVSPHLQAEVQKVLTAKHEGSIGALRKQASQHQRLSRAQSRAVEQINGQFDAIMAAIEAKRQEVLDDLYTETSSDIRDLSDGIESNLQTMQLLNAAHSSLRTAEPLLPPQLATIASALKAPPATPATNSKPKKVGLNLEGVMNELNALAYCIAADDRLVDPPRGRSALSPAKRVTSPHHHHHRQLTSPISNKLAVTDDAVSLAASQPGTSLFNFPLQEDLEQCRGLEWRLRVEDSGDWLGVGVGVGGTLESWAEGSVFDLHHLWVVPQGASRLLVVRLTRMGNVNVKLTIHDRTGRQLDDGRIPHWNVKRTCFPQVSFGGRHGRVVMISAPTRL